MIRQAKEEDLDSIMEMLVKIKEDMLSTGNTQWDENYPLRSDIEGDIIKGDLFVYDSGEIEGFACINRVQPEAYSTVVWAVDGECYVIHRAAVKLGSRHKGIAKAFIIFAEELAVKNGVYCIRTDTCSENVRIQMLMDKMGYSRRGSVNFPGRSEEYYCFDKVFGF